MNIYTLLFFVVGYILGFIISFIVWKPYKSWNDGYDKARFIYNNWDKGYEEGWKDGYNQTIKEKVYNNLKKEREINDLKDVFIELY